MKRMISIITGVGSARRGALMAVPTVFLVLAALFLANQSPTKPVSPKRSDIVKAADVKSASDIRQSAEKLKSEVRSAMADLPMAFEPNMGQTDPRVKYLTRGAGYTVFLTDEGAVIRLKKAKSSDTAVVTMLFSGNHPRAITPSQRQSGRSNYAIGPHPINGVPNYGRVNYEQVFPGVDTVFYGEGSRMRYDLVLHKGADPKQIAFTLGGAQEMSVDADGNLVLKTGSGDVVYEKPVIYQEIAGVKRPVAGAYRLLDENRVGFDLGQYDTAQPLVIDPLLNFSTFVGGTLFDQVSDIAADVSGSYMVGTTISPDFPCAGAVAACSSPGGNKLGPPVKIPSPNFSAFVLVLNRLGTARVYSTYLGGSSQDFGIGIAVPNNSSAATQTAAIIGETLSPDLPGALNAQQGNEDLFVTLLKTDGTVNWTRYVGGPADDVVDNVIGSTVFGHAITFGGGNIYITGVTQSASFAGSGAPGGGFQTSNNGGFDAFAAELSGAGAFSAFTFLGGSGLDIGNAIAFDSVNSRVAVVGRTFSIEAQPPGPPPTYKAFPLAPQVAGEPETLQDQNNAASKNTTTGLATTSDAFLTGFNANLSGVIYSTFIGGSSTDVAQAVAFDASSNVYVVGLTSSPNFAAVAGGAGFPGLIPGSGVPVPAFPAPAGPVNGWIFKLRTTGPAGSNALDSPEPQGAAAACDPNHKTNCGYGSFAPGSGGFSQANGVVVDTSGQATVVGSDGAGGFLMRFSADASTVFQTADVTNGGGTILFTSVAEDSSRFLYAAGLTDDTAVYTSAPAGAPPLFPLLAPSAGAFRTTPPSAPGVGDGFEVSVFFRDIIVNPTSGLTPAGGLASPINTYTYTTPGGAPAINDTLTLTETNSVAVPIYGLVPPPPGSCVGGTIVGGVCFNPVPPTSGPTCVGWLTVGIVFANVNLTIDPTTAGCSAANGLTATFFVTAAGTDNSPVKITIVLNIGGTLVITPVIGQFGVLGSSAPPVPSQRYFLEGTNFITADGPFGVGPAEGSNSAFPIITRDQYTIASFPNAQPYTAAPAPASPANPFAPWGHNCPANWFQFTPSGSTASSGTNFVVTYNLPVIESIDLATLDRVPAILGAFGYPSCTGTVRISVTSFGSTFTADLMVQLLFSSRLITNPAGSDLPIPPPGTPGLTFNFPSTAPLQAQVQNIEVSGDHFPLAFVPVVFGLINCAPGGVSVNPVPPTGIQAPEFPAKVLLNVTADPSFCLPNTTASAIVGLVGTAPLQIAFPGFHTVPVTVNIGTLGAATPNFVNFGFSIATDDDCTISWPDHPPVLPPATQTCTPAPGPPPGSPLPPGSSRTVNIFSVAGGANQFTFSVASNTAAVLTYPGSPFQAPGAETGWLRATAPAGGTPSNITVSIDPTVWDALPAAPPPGILYTGAVQITRTGGAFISNSPFLIPVAFVKLTQPVAIDGPGTNPDGLADNDRPFKPNGKGLGLTFRAAAGTGQTTTQSFIVDLSTGWPGIFDPDITIDYETDLGPSGAVGYPGCALTTDLPDGTFAGSPQPPLFGFPEQGTDCSHNPAGGVNPVPNPHSWLAASFELPFGAPFVPGVQQEPVGLLPPGIVSIVHVTADVTNLAPGDYTGKIRLRHGTRETTFPAAPFIINSLSGKQPPTIPVLLHVIAAPAISASPNPMTFVAQQGGAAPPSQTLNVTVANAQAGGTITATASTAGFGSGSSFTVTPVAGGTNSAASFTVSFNQGSLPSGVLNASIKISANGAPDVIVPVTFIVTTLQVAPSATVNFSSTSPAAPPSQTISVTTPGANLPLTVDTTATAAWLKVLPAGGATPTTITLTVDVTTLTPQAAPFTTTFTLKSPNLSNLTVTVNFQYNSVPAVTTQPANVTVNAGQPASFTAAANGFPAPTVQWQVSTDGGVTWNNITGATSTTFTIAATTAAMNGNRYRAVFTNVAGSVTTNAATLTVDFIGAVITQPVSVSVAIGSNATFTAAVGPSNPAATVQWQISTDGGANFTNITGNPSATTTTLSVAVTSLTQNGNQFRAVFTNVAGSVTTNAATLTVLPAPTALRFVPLANSCRAVDTRNAPGTFGGPFMAAGSTRDFPLPSAGGCTIPPTAMAYAINATVVPRVPNFGFLTLFPTGSPVPNVSTLNAVTGLTTANGAIVPANASGSISAFVLNDTDLILDITGYFVSASTAGSLQFFPLTPCRTADTRTTTILTGGTSRNFTLAGSCGVPASAKAISMNLTAVPASGSPAGFVTAWPAGQAQPATSTLNTDAADDITANGAIVGLGSGSVSVFSSVNVNVVIDVNGYYAAPAAGGSDFFTVTPCRDVDTRFALNSAAGPQAAGTTVAYGVGSACGLPAGASAYALNVTVVPTTATGLGFLTLWPNDGSPQPIASTINDLQNIILANNATVTTGTGGGSLNIFVTNATQIVLDVNGYFKQ